MTPPSPDSLQEQSWKLARCGPTLGLAAFSASSIAGSFDSRAAQSRTHVDVEEAVAGSPCFVRYMFQSCNQLQGAIAEGAGQAEIRTFSSMMPCWIFTLCTV